MKPPPVLKRQDNALNLHDLESFVEKNNRMNRNSLIFAGGVLTIFNLVPHIIQGLNVLIKTHSFVLSLSKIWSSITHQTEAETQKPSRGNPELTDKVEELLTRTITIEHKFEEALKKIEGIDILDKKLLSVLKILPEVNTTLRQINTFFEENINLNHSSNTLQRIKNVTYSKTSILTNQTKNTEKPKNETENNTKEGFSKAFYISFIGLSALGLGLLRNAKDKNNVISDQKNVPVAGKNKKKKN